MQPLLQYCQACQCTHAPGQHKARPKADPVVAELAKRRIAAAVKQGVDKIADRLMTQPMNAANPSLLGNPAADFSDASLDQALVAIGHIVHDRSRAIEPSKLGQNRTKKPLEPKKPKAKKRVTKPRTAKKPPDAELPARPEVTESATSQPSSSPKDPKKMTRAELEELVAAVIAKENHKRKLKAKHQATWRNRHKEGGPVQKSAGRRRR